MAANKFTIGYKIAKKEKTLQKLDFQRRWLEGQNKKIKAWRTETLLTKSLSTVPLNPQDLLSVNVV